MTIGQLALQSGVTVRTLRYYDRMGLLIPAERTGAGYRLYSRSDISRLYVIRSLQQIGCSLSDIKSMLTREKMSLSKLIPVQIDHLQKQIHEQQGLLERLRSIQRHLLERPDLDHASTIHLLTILHTMNHYFTDEQMQKIKKQGEKLGTEHIKAVEAEWPVLIAQVRKHMEQGTDPHDPAVGKLAQRWMELVSEFTGGDKGIEQSLGNMYQQEQPSLQASFGDGVPTPDMFGYVQKALGK